MLGDYNITLTSTEKEDLEILFLFQLDNEGNYLAAFTSKDPSDKAAYIEKYSRFLTEPTINMRTIRVENKIVGSISKFVMGTDNEITYWIDKEYWGRGIATEVLKLFLKIENNRPIFGRVAFDNFGSQRVLEKADFIKVGADNGFANARQTEIEELIYKLSD
ncbi:MAG: GNAT family N-acetyltransferase [Ferruginibacter sp.]